MWPIRIAADGKKIFSPGYLLSSVSYEIDSEETEQRIRFFYRVCYCLAIFLPYIFEPVITDLGLLGWIISAILIWVLFKSVTLYLSRSLLVWIETPKKRISERLSKGEKIGYTAGLVLLFPAWVYFTFFDPYRAPKDYLVILVMFAILPVLCFNAWQMWKR